MISNVARALLDLLACLEPKLWPKKRFTPKFRKIRKCMSLPLAASHNPPEDASELCEPSKDSWSLPVCTEKKTF